jgi:hypothetical protein
VAAAIGAAGTLGVAAVFPYVLSLLPPDKLAHLPPLAVLVPLQMVQALVLFTLMAWLGLHLGPQLGLDAPRLRAWILRTPSPPAPLPWRPIVLGSLLTCAMVFALQAGFSEYLPPTRGAEPPHPSASQGFLASFYGGIAEELQLRLFLMTSIAWALWRGARGRISLPAVLWTANILAAVAFGAGHLPAAAQVWPLDPIVVTYIVAGNAVAGLVFGRLYAIHGLEAAMAAHFLADIGLHVVAPLVQGQP